MTDSPNPPNAIVPAPSSSIALWAEPDVGAMMDDYEHAKAATSVSDFLEMSVGRNIVRFLPPKPGEKTPFLITFVHRIPVPGQDDLAFTCLRLWQQQLNRKCPGCEDMEELRKTGNPADRDVAYEMRPKKRVLAEVLSRKDPHLGVKILGFGEMIHQPLLTILKSGDAGGNFTHPLHGFDINLEKTDDKSGVKYQVIASRHNRPLGDEAQIKEWLSNRFDLAAQVRVHTYDEIRAAIRAGAWPDTRNKGGAKSPAGSSNRTPASQRTVQTDLADSFDAPPGHPAGPRDDSDIPF